MFLETEHRQKYWPSGPLQLFILLSVVENFDVSKELHLKQGNMSLCNLNDCKDVIRHNLLEIVLKKWQWFRT